MIKNTILFAFILLLVNGTNAQKTSDKINFKHKLKIYTRVQSLFVANSVLDVNNKLGDINTNTMIRRARVKLTGKPYKNFEYKLELGISNRDLGSPTPQVNNASNVVLDGFTKWEFLPGLKLVVGQTKLPGNRERVVSSQKLQFVVRSLVNSKFNIDRDLGVQLHHQWKHKNWVFREQVALSQGEGKNIVKGNLGGAQYTGRIEILPMGLFTKKGDYFASDLYREAKPKLMLGFTVDNNDRAGRANGNTKEFFNVAKYNYSSQTLNTMFADLIFKHKGLSVMAEFANKKAKTSSIVRLDTMGTPDKFFYTGSGINVQLGYLFKNNYEIAARFTQINPSKENKLNNSQMYTLGMSKYVKGHNLKIQTDVSQTVTENKGGSKLMYRLQFEFGF